MKAQRVQLLLATSLAFWAASAFPQSFSSGSSGADGDWNPACTPPATTCTLQIDMPPSGVFNYGSVTIPSGVTIRYNKNAANTPVTILATGDVTINGAISVNGTDGAPASASATFAVGLGGPGGFNGGNGQLLPGFPPQPGLGPGGGTGAADSNGTTTPGNYGAPGSFLALQPLFGGSGGGGGIAFAGAQITGMSGGGGGGAILIASSGKISITSSGGITANGGGAQFSFSGGFAGGGSGGAIRLVAREVASAGLLQAKDIRTGTANKGGPGRIRVEALLPISLTGTTDPAASLSNAPGPVSAAGNPALINLPTISIGTVGTIVPNSPPAGALTSADAILPQGTTNPVPVTIALTNTPVGGTTAITLKVAPLSGTASSIAVPAASHTGTFAASSATTNVTFPSGSLTIIQAWATFTITSTIAQLMPSIDGEPVERVMVASEQGMRLVTRSGKERSVAELPREQQIRVALALEAMKGLE